MKTEKTKKQSSGLSLLIFIIILFLVFGTYFYYRNLMPEHIIKQGQKYLAAGQYDKALRLFDFVGEIRPYDTYPLYYQTLTLSKMPVTYENQKRLYEIAQLENFDEASILAEKILKSMQKQLNSQAGSNYADNIMFDDVLIRWNNSEPITYSLLGDSSVSQDYYKAVKSAFDNWQKATNGQVLFKEISSPKNAKIVVNFMNAIPISGNYESEASGKTIPVIDDNNVLKQMEIYLRTVDLNGNDYDFNNIHSLAMHEIGHALGLGGHSSNFNDIMYYTGDFIGNESYKKNITARDINTFNLLYRMLPDITDIPVNPKDYNNLFYHRIITSYSGENFKDETKRLISQIQNDKQNIKNWVDLAINYAKEKQYERSNYILYHVLPMVKNDVHNTYVILYNLAVNYYKLRDYNSAAKYLMLVQSIQSDLDTQILDAFIDVRRDKLSQAEKKLKLLSDKNPDNIEIALKLAEIYYIKKDKKSENEVINNLIKNNPKAMKDRRVLKYKAKKTLIHPSNF